MKKIFVLLVALATMFAQDAFAQDKPQPTEEQKAWATAEEPTMVNIWAAKVSILYAGVMSCGVAYTLQILGQKHTDPTTATLLMSLESVFAVLAGWVLLNESLSVKELSGCVLVFIAVILAQVPLPVKAKKN